MEKNEIVLFETEDNKIKLDVPVSGETVWLTQDQMSKLFDTARSSVAYHINNMRFGDKSDLFGKEKDDSFKGSIGNIYQSFDGRELYPSMEE